MWLFLTLTSFVAFLASLFGFVWRGCNREGRMRRSGPLFLAVALVSFVVWCFALPRVPPPYPMERLKNYIPPPEVKGDLPAPSADRKD